MGETPVPLPGYNATGFRPAGAFLLPRVWYNDPRPDMI